MSCPPSHKLQQLADGMLPADQQMAVRAHLENCAPCRGRMEELAATGVSGDKVAASQSDDTAAFRSEVNPPETPTSAEGTQPQAHSSGADDDLSFLAASDKPGALGRLDEYEIFSILGKGGFGIVLKAFDENLRRMVAIKVMSPHLASNAAARQRFMREARAAAPITHENVVTIHAVSKNAKIPYLAMQLVNGITLSQKIDRTGALHLRDILRIGVQVAEGLAAAHSQGLVHRDIKPGNILLEDDSERVKITDFGLARAVDDASVTQSGTVAGTPMYMSPEQAEGLPVDHRSDLFSLGSVLYAMCTGRPPFRATTTMAVMKRVCEDTPTPVQQVNPQIPAWLGDVITRLHAKKPEDRFQSAKEVADLLGRQLATLQTASTSERSAVATMSAISRTDGDPDATATLDSPARSRRQSARRRLFALAGAVLFIGLVVASAVWGLFWGFNRFTDEKGKPPPTMEAHEILPRLVGAWSIEFEASQPKTQSLRGVVRFDWLANKKFVRAHTTYDDGKETVAIYRHDAQGFRNWSLSSSPGLLAIQGPGAGQWDAKTATLTWQYSMPLFHKLVHEQQWIDTDIIETRSELKDHQGAVVLQQKKRMHRRAVNDAVGSKTPVDATRPQETVLLDRLVGKWTTEGEVTLAEAGDRKVKSRSTQTIQPILGGRFFEAFEHSPPNRDDYWILGYDENRKTYRFWHFLADGTTMEVDGTYDAKTKKLAWKSVGETHVGAWTFTGLNERRFSMAAKTPEGRRLYEITSVSRRTDAPEKSASQPASANVPFSSDEAKSLQETWAKHLGVDVEIKNALNMKLRLIPPGEFVMGSEEKEIADAVKRSQPWNEKNVFSEGSPRKVVIREPFYLGIHEVTVGQFRAFVKETKHQTWGEKTGKGGRSWDSKKRAMVLKPGFFWNNPFVTNTENHPVVLVHREDVEALCDWLNKKDGRTYVIPTEEQWEFACRAGTTKRWYWGDDEEQAHQFGWFSDAATSARQMPVGLKTPNAFGLHDMAGNVAEMTLDAKNTLIMRGGHAGYPPIHTRSAARERENHDDPTYRNGVRLAVINVSKTSTQEAEHRAAAWILARGGRVRIQFGKEERDADLATLPKDAFFCIDADLESTDLDDDGLKNLAGLTRLARLNLARTPVGDAGMIHLKDLRTLSQLQLYDTRIGDLGLTHLEGLTALTKLTLGRTHVTGDGMKYLKGMTRLEELRLYNTRVDEEGLKQLHGLTELRVLQVKSTKVSPAAATRLSKVLTKCRIEYDGGFVGPP